MDNLADETFETVLDALETKLNRVGTITLRASFKHSGLGDYSRFSVAFRKIMELMCEQDKARKIVNGRYEILKPNKL